MMYVHMYVCMYVCIPCVSSPLVSGIVYVCISYMRSPESPVPRSPALYMYAYFIWDSLSLQSPGLRHLYIIPGVSSPQISKILYLCIFSMCTTPRDLQHGLCMFINTNAPPSPTPKLFVDHHHLDQTNKPYQFLTLPSNTVTQSNSFTQGLSDTGTKSP